MKDSTMLLQEYMDENKELRMRLKEAQEAIKAIRSGLIDALIIDEEHSGTKLYSHRSADESYRILIQEMNEGAVIISKDGLILFANNSFAELIKMSLETVIGSSIYEFINPGERNHFDTLLAHCTKEKRRIELTLRGQEGTLTPVYLSSCVSSADNLKNYYFLVVTDLTEQKRREAITASEKLARSIMEQANEVIVVCDGEGRIIRTNQKANNLCHANPAGQLFENAFPCYLPSGEKFLLAKSVKSRYNQEVILHSNGRKICLLVNAGHLHVEGSRLLGSVITLTDITELKQLATDLAQEKMFFKTTLVSVGDGVISCDTKGNVLFLNKVAENLTGWTEDIAKGKDIEEVFNRVNELAREKDKNIVKLVTEKNEIIEPVNHVILIAKNGLERPIEYSAAPIVHEEGKTTGLVLVFRDITERKHKQEEIEYLSYFDHLTGLYNRRFYEEELRRLDVERNLPIALIMMDLNGLKLTNDAFGHHVGDELLRRTANILKNVCRADDIVARVGGDEFVILLPRTNEQGVSRIAKRINAAVSKEKFDNIIFSISIGCAVKQVKTENMYEIYKKAEDSMYRSKLLVRSSVRGKNISLIINSLFEKSNREMLHSKRVSEICEAIAISMNLSRDIVNQTKTAGLMHDIGKIGIRDDILNNNGKLNDSQWSEMKRHPEIGYRILGSANEYSEMANSVLEHHERWDGKGYPKGIKGESISLQARIIAIADAYDAMTSFRPYRKIFNRKEAASEIKRCSGTQFDARIAKVFIEKVLGKDWDQL